MKDTADSLQYLLSQELAGRMGKEPNVWNDASMLEEKIQSTLTDLAFKKSQMEQEIETAQMKYIKKTEIALRSSFLKRFHFPMRLAREEFCCYITSDKTKFFSYKGQIFAMEKQLIDINSDGNTHCATVSSRICTIYIDAPLPDIIRRNI